MVIDIVAEAIGHKAEQLGERLVDMGDEHRALHSNPREVPELTLYEKVGQRVKNLGQKLVDFSQSTD